MMDFKGVNLQFKTLAVSVLKSPTELDKAIASEDAKARWADGGVMPIAKAGMVVAST